MSRAAGTAARPPQLGPRSLDRAPDRRALVDAEFVHDDDIARLHFESQYVRDRGKERVAIHRAIKKPRRAGAAQAWPGNKSRRAPVARLFRRVGIDVHAREMFESVREPGESRAAFRWQHCSGGFSQQRRQFQLH